jgi:TM2 domain-containing membrane protein YozV
MCRECERPVRGVIYCEDCLAGRVQGAPIPSQASTGPRAAPRAGLAAFLAVILPFGVAQAYLGQYARGIVHLVVFCVLTWGANNAGSASSLFGIGIAAFYCYQIIDAVRSAHALAAGRPAPDPFNLDSLFDRRFGTHLAGPHAGRAEPAAEAAPEPVNEAASPAPEASAPAERCCSGVPTSAIVLIVLGVIFLLGRSGFLHWFWIGSMWPLIFIAIGVALLVKHWENITTRHCRLMGPAVMFTLGALFLMQSSAHISFGRSFPLLLIVIGAVLLWQRMGRASVAAPAAPPAPPAATAPAPAEHGPDDSGEDSEVKGS